MSYGGSIQAMLTTIKNNKLLMKKRRNRREKLKDYVDADYEEIDQSPTFTPEQVLATKERMRLQTEKAKRKSLLIIIVSLIITPFVMWLAYWAINQLTTL